MRAVRDIPKKRGRPATGKDPMLTFRVPADLRDRIDNYAEDHVLPRSEALRRLVKKGLAAK
jgi:hypothetical protein